MSLPSDINPQLLALSSGYNLTRSLRFRASAGGYLSRTNTGTVTNSSVWTWSAWVKIGYWSSGNAATLMGTGTNGGTDESSIKFVNNNLEVINYRSSVVKTRKITTQVFRDPSAWYHIIVANNSSTSIKIYVNGVEVTSFGTSTGPGADAWVLNTASQSTGIGYLTSAQNFDGQMTEINFIDGQALTPSSFGSTNALTGVWQPARYTGTYGTNGFYLPFTDNSALTTASNVGLGKDFSGNGNYWTTNNISITAGVTYDSMTDVPTLTSATAANFAVINPLDAAVGTASNGNLTWTCGASNGNFRGSIAIPASGKFYFEGTVLTTTSISVSISFGVAASTASLTTQGAQSTLYQLFAASTGVVSINGSNVGTLGTFSAGDVLQVAVDVTNSKLWLGKNNVFYDSSGGTTGNPSTGANPVTTNSVVGSFAFGSCYQDTLNANFGQRPFTYTPPTGFVALNTFNLPTSTIVKGNTVMDATIYSGDNASPRSITNAAGFKPDLVWVKSRSNLQSHKFTDSVRGAVNAFYTDTTSANDATPLYGSISAFNSNGFALSSGGSGISDVNASGQTYVAWQWQAGQGTNVTNTSGSITSTVSVNASAGFSIVSFTGNATLNATVGHGLGVAPTLVIYKNKVSAALNWAVISESLLGLDGYVYLNTTAIKGTGASELRASTSSVLTLPATYADINPSGQAMLAYCFAPIAGYSAFGTFVGNGSVDGNFLYLGFLPKFFLLKSLTAVENWWLWDTTRGTFNVVSPVLNPNSSAIESTLASFDFVSNGIKLRASTVQTYMYLAFASNPFKNSLAF